MFLDLKLHDIPATVSRAMAGVAELGVRLATVHCGENPRHARGRRRRQRRTGRGAGDHGADQRVRGGHRRGRLRARIWRRILPGWCSSAPRMAKARRLRGDRLLRASKSGRVKAELRPRIFSR
ncbi:MAG: orotidine 5'-phosphate decarboxylase [Desulfobacterales bacterium]|nr:orotidine 5'-phosphate decarboxylase [Desulfobacterales bacterium]